MFILVEFTNSYTKLFICAKTLERHLRKRSYLCQPRSSFTTSGLTKVLTTEPVFLMERTCSYLSLIKGAVP